MEKCKKIRHRIFTATITLSILSIFKVYVLFHGGIVLISLNRPGYSSNIIRVLDHCSTKKAIDAILLRLANVELSSGRKGYNG